MKAIRIDPGYVLIIHKEYGEVVASLRFVSVSKPGVASSHTTFDRWPIMDAIKRVESLIRVSGTLYVLDPEDLWDPSWGELVHHELPLDSLHSFQSRKHNFGCLRGRTLVSRFGPLKTPSDSSAF